MMKKLALLSLTLIAFSLPAHAATDQMSKGASTFIENLGNRAISFLKESNALSQDDQRKRFAKILSDGFDMKTIARFSMGRYWRAATPAQKKEYLPLFEDMVIDIYANRLENYSDEEMAILQAKTISERDVIVKTEIVPTEGPKINVDWRVRYKDKRYQVIDVIVEGVSMSVTQRSDFASVIQRNGGSVDALITHLRDMQKDS